MAASTPNQPKYIPLTQAQIDAQLADLKQIVVDHLQGEFISVTQDKLRRVCTRLNKSSKQLFKSILLDQNDVHINAILASLEIRKARRFINSDKGQDHYHDLFIKSQNLYDLLTNLNHNGHEHIDELLKMIENTKPKRNWTWVFAIGAVLTAIIGLVLGLKKDYRIKIWNWICKVVPELFKWIGKTLSSARNIPLIGMIFTALGLAYTWFQTLSNGTTGLSQKLKKLSFKTITEGLNIAGYALSYIAYGALSGTAAILFVVSASLELFKAVYMRYKYNSAFNKMTAPGDRDPWEAHAAYARARNLRDISEKSFKIEFGSAVVTTIAIAIWCFCPASLYLTIVCIIFLALVALTKQSWASRVREKEVDNLQDTLKGLQKEYPLENSDGLVPSVTRRDQKTQQAARRNDLISGLSTATRDIFGSTGPTLVSLADRRKPSDSSPLNDGQRPRKPSEPVERPVTRPISQLPIGSNRPKRAIEMDSMELAEEYDHLLGHK